MTTIDICHWLLLISSSSNIGLTETNGAVAIIRGDVFRLHPTSTGRPFPIVEAAIVDVEKGKRLPVNEIGELWLRSSLTMKVPPLTTPSLILSLQARVYKY